LSIFLCSVIDDDHSPIAGLPLLVIWSFAGFGCPHHDRRGLINATAPVLSRPNRLYSHYETRRSQPTQPLFDFAPHLVPFHPPFGDGMKSFRRTYRVLVFAFDRATLVTRRGRLLCYFFISFSSSAATSRSSLPDNHSGPGVRCRYIPRHFLPNVILVRLQTRSTGIEAIAINHTNRDSAVHSVSI